MDKEYTPISEVVKQLKQWMLQRESEITSSDFKYQYVFIHHGDDSYFVFQDAFLETKQIEHIVFRVVFSFYVEPMAFFDMDLEGWCSYGEAISKEGEDTEWNPIRGGKKAGLYLKEQGRELKIGDFKFDVVHVDLGHTLMHLRSAFVEETEEDYYIFSEHQGFFCFPKNEVVKINQYKYPE